MSDKLTREEIFSQKNIQDKNIQTNDIMKDDFGWEVPVDIAPLPSQGKIYDKESSLYGKETIQIKAMTAKDENILLSKAYIKNGTVINKLLESCIVDKSINVNELLAGDRNAILLAIRITGYGSDYRTRTTCPHCEKESEHIVNLSDLTIKRFGSDPVELGKNLFSVELPFTRKTVFFKLLTAGDEEEIFETAKRKEEMLGIKKDQSVVTDAMLNTIVAIDNITDRNKLTKFVENMPARDARFLRSHIAATAPSIDMNSMFTCPSCAKEAQVGIKLGLGFFWPDSGL